MNHSTRCGRFGPVKSAFVAAFVLGTAASNICANPIAEAQVADGGAGVVASATGGGHYVIGFVGDPLDVKFSMSANQLEDGSASGHFQHEVIFGGLLVDFSGVVTCVSVDSEAGRAWIGGIVTKNRSEHPAFTEERHDPGRDIWFRVLDSGEGQAEPDRSTFVGFEGDAGFITSQAYCDEMPWPEDNARTSPVTEGNIQVRP